MNHAPGHDVAHYAAPAAAVEHEHASPPIKLYLQIWGLLFVLSGLSYAVDYFAFEGLARWILILIFMILKAGLIVAIFMHMAWERMALIYAILVPPLALGTLVWLMLIESDYTFWTRILFFDGGA
jgi:cytochrome c oxidase subunit IV